MSTSDDIERGRDAFRRRAWADAHARLSAADPTSALERDDLERLATAAYLLGRHDESSEVWARAHQVALDREDAEGAARCAFWLGFQLLLGGERARGGGWIARARRLLDDAGRDCVERGFLELPGALGRLAEGDVAGARAAFGRAEETGRRFGEPDLVALGRLGRGQALVRSGAIEDGVALLDETMVAVETGELSPVVVGIVYCAVLETCREIFDLGRAREWTSALSDWCASQPELVPFRGQCLVRRSEILQLEREWTDAMEEARRACDLLSAPPGEPAAGDACYQRGELHRLRGEFEEAEEAYRRAAEWGRDPHPGLALLRLAQGRIEDAEGAIRRVAGGTDERSTRCRALASLVEIVLAAGDVPAARTASEELSEIAAEVGAPHLRAIAARVRGAVRLAEGDARAALEVLQPARRSLDELGASYEVARVRVLVGLACREVGDEDTAAVELDAARDVFRRLGAKPDLARLDDLERPPGEGDAHGLTPRELEVLRLVAEGATNRAIGEELVISERTVERHVSHIFQKLRVSTRTAAAAFAYEHDLV